MSQQKIDKLFKERLSGLEQAPSAEAWTKLEGMLVNKKKKVLYFRLQIAAAITLVLLSGWVIWSSQRSIVGKEIVPLAETIPLIDSVARQNIAQKEIDDTNTVEKEHLSNQKPNVTKPNVVNRSVKIGIEMLANKVQKAPAGLDTISLKTSLEPMLAENTKQDEALIKQVNETLPPVMIIYKQSSQSAAQASENTNEKVTWDAVLTVAKDLKEGNISLSSRLKEAKEDLFALRFTNKNKDNTK